MTIFSGLALSPVGQIFCISFYNLGDFSAFFSWNFEYCQLIQRPFIFFLFLTQLPQGMVGDREVEGGVKETANFELCMPTLLSICPVSF
jgi:hypothetical protein